MSKLKYIVAGGTVLVAVTALAPSVVGAEPSAPVVVVSGLNNPRQLSLVGGNDLLIAEAGKGGDTAIGDGPEGPQYVGYSGAVSEVVNPATAEGGSPNRIVTGLFSAAGQDGSAAVGSDGVSGTNRTGAIYVGITYAPPDVLPAPPSSPQIGRLIRAKRDGSFRPIANVSKYEIANDPDGQGPDSNPYAVLALPDGSELVADAAGNDVVRVSSAGISVFHVFPNITGGKCAGTSNPTPEFPGCNFVPTALARDAAGNIYVGGLGSLTPKAGKVVKLSPDGTKVLHTYGGFTAVSGVAVGADGTLYVSQLFGKEAAPPFPGIRGSVTRVAKGNVRTSVDVPFAAGLAVDSSDNVYVAAWSIAPETGLAGPATSGQVWRLHF